MVGLSQPSNEMGNNAQNYRFRRLALASALFWAALAIAHPATAGDPGIKINAASNSFTFIDDRGDRAKTITVYTYLPKQRPAAASRIVFVLHGRGKNAQGMRDTWAQHADQYGWLIVAPLFDPTQWAGNAYSYGNVLTRDGKPREASLWSFNVVEHLFDAIKTATGNQSVNYFLYGHSEGGQFVHRLVQLLPDARFARAIAANPGWYTMPAFNNHFPYGLGGAPANQASLKKSFTRDFALLLGDRDTDPNHPQLRRSPQAMAQGAHRFERGQNYMKQAAKQAKALDVELAWQLEVVPGVAHENREMAQAAARLFASR